MVARPGEGPRCSTDSVPWGSGWGRSLEGRQEEIPLPYGWTEPLWDNFERLEAAWGI